MTRHSDFQPPAKDRQCTVLAAHQSSESVRGALFQSAPVSNSCHSVWPRVDLAPLTQVARLEESSAMPPAARLGDLHTCPMVTPGTPPIPHVGGPISGPCQPNVLIGGQPA